MLLAHVIFLSLPALACAGNSVWGTTAPANVYEEFSLETGLVSRTWRRQHATLMRVIFSGRVGGVPLRAGDNGRQRQLSIRTLAHLCSPLPSKRPTRPLGNHPGEVQAVPVREPAADERVGFEPQPRGALVLHHQA